MKEDRKIKARRAGEEIEELVSNYQVREAWSKNQWWYRESKGHRVPPTRNHMDQTSTLREDLYRHLPPEDEIIPILVQPVSIKEATPEVGEISAEVRKFRPGRAGGPLGMKAEHLKVWLRAATREKEPDTKTWDKVVSVIHAEFWEGYIPEALMWTTMVLIPNGKGEYRGIGLVETIWKVCTSTAKSRLQSSIVLHDVLHGFR